MDETELRRELDDLRRRLTQLEAEVAVLRGLPGPVLPPERDPFRRPEPPPGGYPITRGHEDSDRPAG